MEYRLNNKKGFLAAIVVFVLLGLVYIDKGHNINAEKISGCVALCEKALDENLSLSNGPCLSNSLPDAPDWVCDIAHMPREPLDNLPENQCNAFREGKAHHFVELDETCNLIRAI